MATNSADKAAEALANVAATLGLSDDRLHGLTSMLRDHPEFAQTILHVIGRVRDQGEGVLDEHEFSRACEDVLFDYLSTAALEAEANRDPSLRDTLTKLHNTAKESLDASTPTGRLALSVALLQIASAALSELYHLVPEQKTANEGRDAILWQALQLVSATQCRALHSAIAGATGLPREQTTSIIEHVYELHRLIAVATDRQWDGHTEDASELIVNVGEDLNRLPPDPFGQAEKAVSALAQASDRHRLASDLAVGLAELKRNVGGVPKIAQERPTRSGKSTKARLKVSKVVDAYRAFWEQIISDNECGVFDFAYLLKLPHLNLNEQAVRGVLGSLDYLTRVWELGMTHNTPPLEPDAPWISPTCDQILQVLWKGGADGGPKRAAFRVAAFSPDKRPRALENTAVLSSQGLQLSHLLEQCLDRARRCAGLFASITAHRDAWLPVHDGLPTLTLKLRPDREEPPHLVFRAGEVCWLPVTGPCAWVLDFVKEDILERADLLET